MTPSSNTIRALTAVVALMLTVTGPAHAAAPALDLPALQACAGLVQQLRSEAMRLHETTAQLDARRAVLDQRTTALQADVAKLDRDDLRATLDLQQRRKQHNDELLAFNAEVARHRRAIAAVNQVKQRYAQDCAERPYRRADLATLPAEAQAAMRAGLDDIEVPYLDPPASP